MGLRQGRLGRLGLRRFHGHRDARGQRERDLGPGPRGLPGHQHVRGVGPCALQAAALEGHRARAAGGGDRHGQHERLHRHRAAVGEREVQGGLLLLGPLHRGAAERGGDRGVLLLGGRGDQHAAGRKPPAEHVPLPQGQGQRRVPRAAGRRRGPEPREAPQGGLHAGALHLGLRRALQPRRAPLAPRHGRHHRPGALRRPHQPQPGLRDLHHGHQRGRGAALRPDREGELRHRQG
mmetsp:Transcript_41474/g.83698  ORF Transcript_41474/g.83698 Transcript_41474/m.83698 type:complete len:235 (+) Transcript_41474:195-899(+)